MGFILFGLACMVVGVLVASFLSKHGGLLVPVKAFLGRLSSPYNALVTFVLCLLLFLGGHNRLPSALGGAFVIVGVSTVAGHALRFLRSLLPRLRPVSLPVRRKKIDDGYWEFKNGQWVEAEREETSKNQDVPEIVA